MDEVKALKGGHQRSARKDSTHVSVFHYWEFTDLLIRGFLPLGLPYLDNVWRVLWVCSLPAY